MKPNSSHFSLRNRRAARGIASAALFSASAFYALHAAAQSAKTEPGLVAHEWGTFTSVAGVSGEAVEWLPLIGPSDLPSFVEHLRETSFKVGLGGRLRMETPVLYFYSSQETKVDVSVSFLHGLITEWYPRATHIEPPSESTNLLAFEQQSSGRIKWTSVLVQPSAGREFPQENRPSHYYAARATEAAPLRIGSGAGTQNEQFLFYRGVSETPPPLTAAVLPAGRIEVANQSTDEIPLIVLFERRGDKTGFRQFSGLRTGAILEAPLLDSSLEAARPLVESALISAGLYPAEARAMLDTWHDSWFEEGSRLIYLVPSSYVEKVLPLSIKPQPDEVHRVFLGRLELLTPATQSSIQAAVADRDEGVLVQKYGRFLRPFLEILLRKDPHAPQAPALSRMLTGIYSSNFAANR